MAVQEAPQARAALTFKDYGLKATKRFLRTAIVIDDEIIAQPPAQEALEAEPPAFAAVEMPVVGDVANGAGEPAGAAEVPIKPLADAFLDKQIVCGVLKPETADTEADVIFRAVQAAMVADVVILDWYLRKTDDGLARKIMKAILKKDQEGNGRLRLVLVYTSAAPLTDRRDKLAKDLADAGFATVSDEVDDTLLSVDACRIRFVQKRVLNSGTAIADLPNLAIEEFAKHSRGLLSNFALLGIGALREASHHVLANLGARMDTAFVGHRMLLGESTGAQGFAMSLFILQMKSILSMPRHLGGALGDDELKAWFDHRFDYAGADEQLVNAGTTKDALRQAILSGASKSETSSHKALFLPESKDAPEKVSSVEKAQSQEFARLATFVRELDGFNPLPKEWFPSLTLGSIVKLADRTARYFMCVQPACDTIRIDEDRYFPFIELTTAKVTNATENLSIRDGSKSLVVAVSTKAGSRHYAEFAPDHATKSIKAETVDGKFVFSSTSKHRYWWIGDIDPMKAQRIAVELSGTLARVGIDEYEWLRRGGSAK